MSDPLRPPVSRPHPGTESPRSGSRSHASLRTAVVWEVLQDALDRKAKATGRESLDVLDTGGGSGRFAVPVARLGHRVTVVDPSPNALFALERRAAEAGLADRVHGVQGDAHGLFDVIERGGFDAVLCHGVLEYVDDPAEGLRNAVAALRPEGVLSLLAAGLGGAVLARALAGRFTEARHALEDAEGRWGEGDPVPRRFTAEQLTGLAEGAGLTVRAVHGVRVFADLVPGVLVDTEPGALDALLKLEAAAAELPAFHSVATQIHVLGETAGGTADA
ncbi:MULTISPECIES: methyltransferase [Streptomyces]|uniref:Methyltransferase domain-containing protein n=1 Tax=Streptomyces thermoviolaceus subsp. thermoviolaceus TaxID=66860 RepID=A0ABX0YVZ2_STRTL|nr:MULTISPECIES: methyltransferase [Streptomyces]MCM3265264.1 methyltransferase domain-containing protein [Streptomyces thermoviolaceus]NJP16772.1 methyltransferase domain-containing protein [Streptomyces thermoviolaceus subsp. thermoviolaceus]WTD49581.1 methyltransferase domain-containing protein [Streptomyces thermoviolaceus]GGV61940.1 methyltransferase [Streptomyces thermoviolaceus subsp. apingens]GHA79157.1 methyltransferase [Streptomyces thermoviolaceus subsp. thermoviolaceus]